MNSIDNNVYKYDSMRVSERKEIDRMSVAELTSKIERLSVEDYNMVVMLIDRLSSQDDYLRKLSADELVEELTQSMKKSDLGYTKSARGVSSSMREKYAV